jgi:uncharacterized protein with ParB-like and HNH nuclease domain
MGYDSAPVYLKLREIDKGKLVLPSIQRSFVWDEGKITRLFDSILRGYPFGTLLFWHTVKNIRFREFDKDYHEGTPPLMEDNEEKKELTVVLDGQQRLQSLYIGCLGTLKGKRLYFNVLSGKNKEALSDEIYEVRFLSPEEAEKESEKIRIALSQQQMTLENEPLIESGETHPIFVSLKSIMEREDFERRNELKRSLVQAYHLDDESASTLESNIDRAWSRLRSEELLNYYIIDKDVFEAEKATDEGEILEIFARINMAGTQLSKSDLIFSLIKLGWRGATESFVDLQSKLNEYRGFDFDKDFIIKCNLLVNDLGSRYEIDKLRNRENLKKIKENFQKCGKALIEVFDFVRDEALIKCDGILGSYNALLPLVYWVHHQRSQKIPESQVAKLTHFLYTSLYTRATVRYSDSRVGNIVRRIISPSLERDGRNFPLKDCLWYMERKERSPVVNEALLKENIDLTLNIVQGGVDLNPASVSNKPDKDHIFPRNLLIKKYGEDEIKDKMNHFANYRFVGKGWNITKSDKPPMEWAKDMPEDYLMEKYLIPKEMLYLDKFDEFLRVRTELIVKKVKDFLSY